MHVSRDGTRFAFRSSLLLYVAGHCGFVEGATFPVALSDTPISQDGLFAKNSWNPLAGYALRMRGRFTSPQVMQGVIRITDLEDAPSGPIPPGCSSPWVDFEGYYIAKFPP